MEYVNAVIKNFDAIAILIICGCGAAYLKYRHTVKVRLAEKKQEFGKAILDTIGDLTNNSHHWSQNSFCVLRGSTSDIERTASNLSVNLGVIDKFRLNQAVKNYREHTYTTWEDQGAYLLYSRKNKLFHRSPVSKIKKSITRLLRFAK